MHRKAVEGADTASRDAASRRSTGHGIGPLAVVAGDASRATVLFVGQLPPPMHGQASVNAAVARGRFHSFRLITHRMDASSDLSEVGRLGWHKVVRLTREWARLTALVLRSKPSATVYSLGMRGRSAFYRDIVLLGTLRALGQRVLLQVHSAGLDGLIGSWSAPERCVARVLYSTSGIIRLATGIGQLDGIEFAFEAVLQTGVDDVEHVRDHNRPLSRPAHVAFVGNLFESKGVAVLLDACAQLRGTATPVRVTFAGAPAPGDTLETWRDRAAACGVGELTRFVGLQTSDEVARLLADADLLCFPTFYESEAKPLVIIEAMRAGLPVVSTRWRAVPDLVEVGATGLLVEPRDASAVADAIVEVVADVDRHRAMGRRARSEFLDRYTRTAFLRSFEAIVVNFVAA